MCIAELWERSVICIVVPLIVAVRILLNALTLTDWLDSTRGVGSPERDSCMVGCPPAVAVAEGIARPPC